MLNLEYISDIDGVLREQQEKTILLKITGFKQKQTTPKRLPLNISLVIDISGSMKGYVSYQNESVNVRNIFNNFPNHFPQPGNPWPNQQQFPQIEPIPYTRAQTKLDLVKKAAQKAISLLNENDTVSLVTFSDHAKLIQSGIAMNEMNKKLMHSAIESITYEGSTNLHEGWLVGATEIAKKQKEKQINRVLLLTDGQVNVGIQDPKTICTDVSALFEKGLTISTFGVGFDFNEDLLQKMANVGGGNSYYINDENKLISIFENEISGLSNVAAEQVKLQLDLPKSVSIVECLNKFEVKDSKYLLTNITNGQSLNVVFKVKIDQPKTKSLNFKMGKFTVEFKDENGEEKTISVSPQHPILSEAEFKEKTINEEIKAQEVIMVIANNKLRATEMLDRGDKNGATKILRDSVLYAQASGNDSRVLSEIDMLNSTLATSDSISSQAFRKDLSYQSYNVRNSKK